MKDFSIYDLIGLCGVITYLLPFVLVQSCRMDTSQLSYSLLNLLGSCCFLISLSHNFNLASFITNIIWVIFSAVGIARCLINQRNVKREKKTCKLMSAQ